MICSDFRDVVYYSLLVDESKDVGKKEQMSIMLHYVMNGNVYEHFISFVHVSNFDAVSLVEYISTTLDACSISLDNCISQCYEWELYRCTIADQRACSLCNLYSLLCT